MNQYIRLYLENRGIPENIASQAAALIAPSQIEAGLIVPNVPLTALLDNFITLYALEGNDALETIEKALLL